MIQTLAEHGVFLWASGLLVVLAAIKFFFGAPFKHLQHTIYLSGTLGAGKTSYAAMAVRYYTAKGYKVYSTFALEGALPFDMSEDPWPVGEKVVVILDEMLRLKKQKFYDIATLTDGLTMARQYGQVVIMLSQSHLSDLGDLEGTFQVFATTKKFLPLGKFGNINIMRFSSNKFRRGSKIKAEGMLTSFVYIPSRIWRDYDSKMIFGLTVNKDLSVIPKDEIPLRRIRREAKWMLRKKIADSLAREEAQRILDSGEMVLPSGAAAPRVAQGGTSRPAGPHEVPRRSGDVVGPGWHRPGGARGRARPGTRRS